MNEYTLRAFADDIVFNLEDPINSLPHVIQKINDLGKLAGFFLNQNKSKILCKNMSEQESENYPKLLNVR